MKKVLGSLLVLAGMAMTANAQVSQRTQYEIELSTDGTTWTNNLEVNPALVSRVFARVHVSYVANGGPTPLFFNGGRMQPLGAGWNQAGGDTVLPFNATGRIVANYGETPTLGRVFGAGTVAAVVAHQYSFGGENYLRFAETAAVNHPGQGSGTNNLTGGAGINTSNNTLSPQLGISERELFVWGMSFNASRAGSIGFTIPQEGFRTSGTTANPPSTRSATWVTETSPFTTVEAPTIDTIGATLTFVPAPGAAALLGLGGLVVGRRRR